jgi:C4-dicarboxylate transporter DctM subunit
LNPSIIGLIGIGILLVCVFIGVPVGFALIIIGFLGSFALAGFGIALAGVGIVPFAITNDANFAVIPLFLLMSEFISASGIGSEAFRVARAWIGHLRGGLAMATVGACGIMAAVSGSSLAVAVVMGRMAYPEMKKYNYSSELASGCIAAGGSLGIMIPPSVAFIIIGILTEVSIGKLFIAGILPGISQILFYWATIYIMCKRNPSLGPASLNLPLKEKVETLWLTWPVILLFGLVIGGIYAGVFTATEAGAIGAFGALIVALGRRSLTGQAFGNSLKNTVKSAAMLMLLLIGAYIFNRFLAVSRIPFTTAEWIAGLGIDRYIILIIILILYIILGMFFDIIAIIILTVPILFPIITAFHFDGLWYGVLMCRVAEMGFISPPFGINLFGLTGVIKVPLTTIFRGVIPFLVADCFNVALLVGIPSIALFLPSLMQ